MDPELQLKHDESVEAYPDLNLSATEYIVIDVERSIWGLVQIWAVACLAFLAIIFAIVMVSRATGNSIELAMVGLASAAACLVGGLIATWVYRRNYFIVSNERVFARIQASPFSYHSQTVELEHIEDCSYNQSGPAQMVLGYGSIRLSTVGDEHTYQFSFVARPAEQFNIINSVVQAVDEGESTKYNKP